VQSQSWSQTLSIEAILKPDTGYLNVLLRLVSLEDERDAPENGTAASWTTMPIIACAVTWGISKEIFYLTVAAHINQSSAPTVFNIIDRTNIRARTTSTVKPQKKPLMARIEGALVEVSTGVDVDELSPANLKITPILVAKLFSDRLTDLREIRSDQDLVPRWDFQ
jgi:hypothetical protein